MKFGRASQTPDNKVHYVSAEDIANAFLRYIQPTFYEQMIRQEIFNHVRYTIENEYPGSFVSRYGSRAMGLDLFFR